MPYLVFNTRPRKSSLLLALGNMDSLVFEIRDDSLPLPESFSGLFDSKIVSATSLLLLGVESPPGKIVSLVFAIRAVSFVLVAANLPCLGFAWLSES